MIISGIIELQVSDENPLKCLNDNGVGMYCPGLLNNLNECFFFDHEPIVDGLRCTACLAAEEAYTKLVERCVDLVEANYDLLNSKGGEG